MSERDSFSKRFGPGILPGISLVDWFRLLAANRLAISPACFVRAASIGYCSFVNSVIRIFERVRYESKLKTVSTLPPVFILGHWRQGTTHLHNLFATDERFHCPTLYQVCYPHTFLTTESTWVSRAIAKHVPHKRPMDNMSLGVDLPFEDEYAICASGLYSPYLNFVFPRRRMHYDRYLTLRDLSDRELKGWKRQFSVFLKKLTLRYERPLVLKSPTHTCRIQILLDLFPEAKFVHIHRNPYHVFQSTQHQVNVALDWYRLQSIDRNTLDDWIIRRYQEMYDSFFEERHLIPKGHYCEVAFEQLEQDPIAEVRRIYSTISLPDFEETADKLKDYLGSVAGYHKNEFPPLSSSLRDRISQEWHSAFSEWGYPTISNGESRIS